MDDRDRLRQLETERDQLAAACRLSGAENVIEIVINYLKTDFEVNGKTHEWLQEQPENDGIYAGQDIHLVAMKIADSRLAVIWRLKEILQDRDRRLLEAGEELEQMRKELEQAQRVDRAQCSVVARQNKEIERLRSLLQQVLDGDDCEIEWISLFEEIRTELDLHPDRFEPRRESAGPG